MPSTRAAFLVMLAASFAGVPALQARPYLPAHAEAARPDAELPATTPGKVASAFLAMLNSGTPQSVKEFEGTYASATRRGAGSAEERVGRVAEMRSQWGSFRPAKVLASSDSGVTVDVKVASGESIEMEFRLSSSEAGKLDSVLITSGGPAVKAEQVTKEQAAEVVAAACAALEKAYVFPEVAALMTSAVRGKLAAGEYDTVGDERDFARRLTEDFRAISKDKHLGVRFDPESRGPAMHLGPQMDQMRRENYGFRKAEVLAGNIGYLRFDVFMDDEGAKQAASSALGFLANCDALVIDLRFNGGGSPDMIRYITSYFFEEPTHLNDMYDRESKLVEEYWTLEKVPGKRFAPDLPIYVLTSSRTFSGAEEFSYNLQNLKRGTIVGETTGGGAHPVRGERLTPRFVMGVPYMRAQNPISHTNWEGRGVAPDIKTSADEALERALVEARARLKK
jgi:hypothetical protein